MAKIKFQEKNNLIVKHKNGEYFSKDLELFKKHCPGHTLNNELAKANKFSYARLDGLMLSYLLDIISIEEILENRTQEKQPEPEPRTADEIRTLLIEQFELDEADLEALSGIIPLWLDKTDEEIISAVKKLLGEGADDANQEKTNISETEDTFENRVASYKQRYGEDHTLTSADDVALMFQFLKLPMPDPQDESHLKLTDLVGKKFSELSFFKPTGDIVNVSLALPTQPVERDNVNKFTKRIVEAKTIEEVEAILKEDKEGGERSTVQKAGQKRIEILKVPQDDPDGKKKDQNTMNSQE